MLHTILDPGNIYVVGFALMFGFAAVVLYAAKRTQEKNGEENTITMKPVNVCLALAATMSGAMLVKASIFANFYDTHSIYAPAA